MMLIVKRGFLNASAKKGIQYVMVNTRDAEFVDDERKEMYSKVSSKKSPPGLNSLSDAETQGQDSDAIASCESSTKFQRFDLHTFEKMMSKVEMRQQRSNSFHSRSTPDNEVAAARRMMRANSLVELLEKPHDTGRASEVGKLQIFTQRRASMRNVLQSSKPMVNAESTSTSEALASHREMALAERKTENAAAAAAAAAATPRNAHERSNLTRTGEQRLEKMTTPREVRTEQELPQRPTAEPCEEVKSINDQQDLRQDAMARQARSSKADESGLRKMRKASLQVLPRAGEAEEVKGKGLQDMRRRSEMDLARLSREQGASTGEETSMGGKSSELSSGGSARNLDQIDLVTGSLRTRGSRQGDQRGSRAEREGTKGERNASSNARMAAHNWWRARVRSVNQPGNEDEDL
eukprot:765810-Hanusia_phi.AAC.5